MYTQYNALFIGYKECSKTTVQRHNYFRKPMDIAAVDSDDKLFLSSEEIVHRCLFIIQRHVLLLKVCCWLTGSKYLQIKKSLR